MKPVYAENIIVAIVNEKSFEWYILEKDFCFLDYTKLEEAYQKKGYKITVDDTQRFGIKILNDSTKKYFLDNIIQYKIESSELMTMLTDETDYNAKLAYNPSILIDFDNEILISHYAEPESFEAFVPIGWKGEYRNFENQVPTNKRYWVGKDGKSMIRE